MPSPVSHERTFLPVFVVSCCSGDVRAIRETYGEAEGAGARSV